MEKIERYAQIEKKIFDLRNELEALEAQLVLIAKDMTNEDINNAQKRCNQLIQGDLL